MKRKRVYLWLTASTIAISTFVFFILSATPVSSQETVSQTLTPTDTPFLQATVTPTPTLQINEASTFKVEFSDLGYGETILNSPAGSTDYVFRLPTNWQLQDGFVRFDLSYQFSPLDTSANLPATFGELRVEVDGQTVGIFTIEEPELDYYRLRVPLPLSALEVGDTAQPRHKIVVTFDAKFLCIIPHKAALVIHPTSFLSLNYIQSPPVPDLSVYPLPFYQRSFEPDEVIFGLPAQPSPAEAAGAVSIAAKLGELTNNQMAISATLDLDIANLLSSPSPVFDQHLIVIGQPQNNYILPLLNQTTDLPVTLHKRQMDLVTQGPQAVSPSQTFTYTFTVTNTTNQSATLSLIDTLPPFTQFVDCDPQCNGNTATSVITWTNNVLAPAKVKNFSLTLKVTDIITRSYLENTITLVEADLGPINADTMVSNISIDSTVNGGQQISAGEKSEYLFATNGKAVAESDGIIQEIVSPWNENRAILIVTGLNDEAIKKASQAMSSETRFPGMGGPVALVQDAFPPEIDLVPPPDSEMTFKDLGYNDNVVLGSLRQRIDYSFFIPMGWQLTDDAFVDFRFVHSQVVEDGRSGFTIFFNSTPVATIALGEETALDGRIQANLPASAAQPGEVNQLTIQVTLSETGCTEENQFQDFWFVAKNNSRIFLDHSQETETTFDLGFYPYPFNNHPSLTDLLFVIPYAPTVSEWENTLRLAAYLGKSAGGQTILPAAALDSSIPESDLADYHIIAVGRPSRNPLIRQVNSELPQPFLPDSDEIEQRVDDVIFRLPPGTDLGYLQLIPSPWNSERAFLAVTGTTDGSVTWASRTLSSYRLRQLKGNLSLVRGLNVDNIDTRDLLKEGVAIAIATAVPELATSTVITSTPTPLVAPTPEPGVSKDTPRPSSQTSGILGLSVWLIAMVVITAVIVFTILVIAFVQVRRRR